VKRFLMSAVVVAVLAGGATAGTHPRAYGKQQVGYPSRIAAAPRPVYRGGPRYIRPRQTGAVKPYRPNSTGSWARAQRSQKAPYVRFGKLRGIARSFQGWTKKAWAARYGCHCCFNPHDHCWYYFHPRCGCYLPCSCLSSFPPNGCCPGGDDPLAGGAN
jgi:hypothetical protein